MRIPQILPLSLTFIFIMGSAVIANDPGDLLRPAEMESLDVSNFPMMSSPDDLGFKLLVPAAIEEDLFIHQNDGFRKIQPMPESLSVTHYYSGPSPLTFFREGVDEEGQIVYLPVGSVEFSSGVRDAIVYLQNRGQQYGALLVDLSLRAQRLGSVRFINLTPANLIVLLNEDRSSLAPGEAMVTRLGTEQKTYFRFRVGAMYEDKARVIFSNRYPFRGEMRILFIGYATGGRTAGESPFRVVSHRDRGPDVRPESVP